MKIFDWLRSRRDQEDEEFFWVGREARRRNARRHGALKGSRAHVSRMAHRRKSPPSLGTVLGVRQPDGSIVRVPLVQREEVAGADPVADAGKGRRG